MKKGKDIKNVLKATGVLNRLLTKNFAKRHESPERRQLAIDILDDMRRMQRDYAIHMNALPTRFGKSYDILSYRKDKENVKLYYTKWEREDLYQAKASLKRLRKFEKREGLRPFEVVEKEARDEKYWARKMEKEDNFMKSKMIQMGLF